MGKRIDLTGQQFNEWTLIEWIPPNERETKSKDYIGQCSCGCIRSFGEEKVAEILKRNGIKFKRQVKVEGIKDQNELPFDFGIYLEDKLIGLIEVQGKQHFDSSLLFSSEDLLYHDVIKEHRTRKMGIPLLLIDYSGGQENTDFNKIEKDIISFIGGI